MAHEHREAEEMQGVRKTLWFSGVALFVLGFFAETPWSGVFSVAAFFLAGWDVLKEAAERLLHARLLDETFLMSVAGLGAIGIGEYREAAAVMLLYQLGEALQDKAVDASEHSIRALLDVRPKCANVVWADGRVQSIAAQEVAVGSIIEVRAGESIPLDGTVIEGSSSADTAALTGESLPRLLNVGDPALSGCVNLTGTIRLRVEKTFADSSATRILSLVEEATEKKAAPERFITRFASIYTPIVVALAVLLALVPPLCGVGTFAVYLKRALNFLVIACPCALVISIPLAFFSGLGRASRAGILIKGGCFLDLLSRAEIAVFDKTGTLTEGHFSVAEVLPAEGESREHLLMLAAYAEARSVHPIAQSIRSAINTEIDFSRLGETQEVSGRGIRTVLDGRELLAGTAAFLRENRIPLSETSVDTAAVLLAYDGTFRGTITLEDRIKSGAQSAVDTLRSLGVRRIVMLTGDRRFVSDQVGQTLGADEVCAELLPEEKAKRFSSLKAENSCNGTILYTGDGINDTPVLALADIGIAMGAFGTDAAMEAADVVMMSDDLQTIPQAIRIARKTMRIARENIALSLGVKLAVLLLSAFGSVALWMAVFSDVGVCLLAVGNSLRALR